MPRPSLLRGESSDPSIEAGREKQRKRLLSQGKQIVQMEVVMDRKTHEATLRDAAPHKYRKVRSIR